MRDSWGQASQIHKIQSKNIKCVFVKSDPVFFLPLKVTELLTWYIFSIYLNKTDETSDRVKINYNIFHKNSNYLTFVKVPLYCWTYLLKK